VHRGPWLEFLTGRHGVKIEDLIRRTL